MGSESAEEITPTATATDTIIQVVTVKREPVENSGSPAAPPTYMTLRPSVISNGENHSTFANAQQEYAVQDVTSEMGNEPAAEIHVAAAAADNATSMNHDASASAQQEYPVQVDGDGQHKDNDAEDLHNTNDPKDFVREDGLISNMESFKREMEVVGV